MLFDYSRTEFGSHTGNHCQIKTALLRFGKNQSGQAVSHGLVTHKSVYTAGRNTRRCADCASGNRYVLKTNARRGRHDPQSGRNFLLIIHAFCDWLRRPDVLRSHTHDLETSRIPTPQSVGQLPPTNLEELCDGTLLMWSERCKAPVRKQTYRKDI